MKFNYKGLSKRLSALALTVGIFLLTPQQVFAQDTAEASSVIPEDAIVQTYEMALKPEELNSNSVISPFSYFAPETFTFQGTRRGADHVMDGNYMAYEVSIKMADGSTNNALPILIQVRKYSGIAILSNWKTFYPDGKNHKVDWITFTGGGTCYFQYANTSSGTVSGPVTLTLTTYSWN